MNSSATKAMRAVLLVGLLGLGCAGGPPASGDRPPLNDRESDAALKALLGAEEFAEYVTITDTTESAEWLRQFWVRHDPTPTTPENEFLTEHDERVYHAIYLFGPAAGGAPWDDRGEVYIRYGQPDERLIHHEGLDTDERRGSRRAPGGDFFGQEETSLNKAGSATEVWTYYRWNETFQFEDHWNMGSFRMVPVTDPFSERDDVAEFYATRLSALDLQPAIHYHEYGRNLIDYSLDVVRFRADSGDWRVDVNLGYPLSELTRGPDSNWIEIRRTMIVRDENEREIYSEGGRIRRRVGPASSHRLMVEQKILELVPGKYTLAVTIEDMNSGKTGTYVKSFRLPAYIVPEVQEISDIEMASYVWSIYEPGTPFIKNGHVVVPLPSRVYLPGQSLALYFEVYNLLLAEDGRTRYEVRYSVSDAEGRSVDDFEAPLRQTHSEDSRNSNRVATLNIDALRAGEYFLTVTVEDKVGHHEKTTVARFKKSD